MRNTASILFGISTATLLLGALIAPTDASAQGAAPSRQVCGDKQHPPTEAAVQGGCIAIDQKKGNCFTCHAINGIASGNVAPPLVAMKARFPDKAKLRAQIWDAPAANPKSVMPPFGRHGILSEEEIDKVVDFMLTL
jgi:sulfur-oxidizing protein SoxX